jgi:hypothetical protein
MLRCIAWRSSGDTGIADEEPQQVEFACDGERDKENRDRSGPGIVHGAPPFVARGAASAEHVMTKRRAITRRCRSATHQEIPSMRKRRINTGVSRRRLYDFLMRTHSDLMRR